MAGTKGDRRSLYSKRMIKEALFELIDRKSLSKISVTEVCELADVNRSTFYKYYEDIFDLHNKILLEFSECQSDIINRSVEYISGLPDPMRMTRKDFYRVIFFFFDTVREKKEICRYIYNINSSNNVHYGTGNTIFHDIAPALFGDKSVSHSFASAYTFVSGGLTAMIMDWLSADCPGTAEQQAHNAADYCYGAFMAEIERHSDN